MAADGKDNFSANGALFIAKDDQIVTWCRKHKKRFEPETTDWMLAVLANFPGVFVDCGASTGWFSVAFAKLGHTVHAFEPNPAVIKRLRDNIAMNDVSVLVHEVAASDRPGLATFWHNPNVSLTSGGSIEHATCRNPEKYMVQRVTLDAALGATKPALIKIDVEGHEQAVLRGAKAIIAEHRPHLVLEANTPDHVIAVGKWCEQNMYRRRLVDERNILCTPE